MIDDFRPAPRRTESLQENKQNLKAETPAAPLEMATIPSSIAPNFSEFHASAPTVSRLDRLKKRWPPTKQEIAVVAGIALLIVSGIGAFTVLHNDKPPVTARPVVVKKVAPKPVVPTTVASSLSGLQVDPALNAKPVTAIMIENSPDSRPQSGLSQANVVFEAIAEGGITRFLALFQDTNPADVGPIRSVRPYYLQWAMGFDAPLAHVGGSPEALNDIKAWGARDLDQFFNSGAYHRINSRYAPHNVYTAVDTLSQLSVSKGFATSLFTPWTRKPEAAAKA
ncbi:DUF3048 domain-containing protein, partial [Polaromonas sp.]|nr:DUF3048 domain-containing protein [Candidatus Saccharibacteria bacterium]